jgi:hypothetical protein
MVYPQGGVALTAGENDALVIVVGWYPCATVVPAPPMLSPLSADDSAAMIPIASYDAAPRAAAITLYRIDSPSSMVGKRAAAMVRSLDPVEP